MYNDFMREKFMSQRELLMADWSMAMINKLLPEPELAPNPYWPGHSPMKLWSIEVVNETMKTEEYYILYMRYQKRSIAGKAAAKRKAKTLEEMMIELAKSATVIRIEDYKLRQIVMERQENYYINKGKAFSYCTVFDETLDRWVVNYIRHRLIKVDGVKYDSLLDELKGKVGKDKAYRIIKCIYLDKIAIAYPQYRRECERQKWECEREARMAA